MPHKHGPSVDTQASKGSSSSLSSLPSVTSVRSQPFADHLDSIRTATVDLETLVQTANTLIDNFASSEKDDFYYGGSRLTLHTVLRAMLVHADSCGGKAGMCYTAAAILACIIREDSQSEDTFQMLHDLAVTWVSHLLFIFKSNRSHSTQPNRTPSEIATPTRNDTSGLMDRGVTGSDRNTSFKEQVPNDILANAAWLTSLQLLERDGYQCLATGFVDRGHPTYKYRKGVTLYLLIGCHILRRGIAIFDSQGDQDTYYSAVTTFDILRNYANLSEQTLGDLSSIIDDPSNGFLLDMNSHAGFDEFQWCLKKTETEHKYTIKIFSNMHGISGLPEHQSKVVEFKDHCAEFQIEKGASSSRRKRPREIPLPEARFINIHAAIAEVLHMSGAGKFLDELLEKFGGGGGTSAVRSWEDLDRVVKLADIKEGFSMLAVH